MYKIVKGDNDRLNELYSLYEIEIFSFEYLLSDPYIINNIYTKDLYPLVYTKINGKSYNDVLFVPMYRTIQGDNDNITLVSSYVVFMHEMEDELKNINSIVAVLYKNRRDFLKLKLENM